MKRKSDFWWFILPLLFVQAVMSHGDILIDDFNAARVYPPCCGRYGAYDSFLGSVIQDGAGTLIINATNIDGGGVYHDGLGTALWNFYGQTGLVIRARALTNNTAKTFVINFQDQVKGQEHRKRMFFKMPFSSLNTTSFTTITKSLIEPDFYDDGYNPGNIGGIDILADYEDDSHPTFGLELDFIKTIGPSNAYFPERPFFAADLGPVLKWPTHVQLGAADALDPLDRFANVVIPNRYVSNKLSEWRAAKDPVQWHRLLREVTFIVLEGDVVFEDPKDSVAEEFKDSLLRTNRGRLSPIAWAQMVATIEHLGFLAATSNVAMSFLVQGANPEFWRMNITWTSDLGERQHFILAGRCLSALALSRRDEFFTAGAKLNAIYGVHPLMTNVDLADAMFTRESVARNGIGSFKANLGTHRLAQQWKDWIKTTTITNWSVWLQKYDRRRERE